MRLPLDASEISSLALAAFLTFPGLFTIWPYLPKIAFYHGIEPLADPNRLLSFPQECTLQAVRRFFFPNQRRLPDYFGLRCIFSGFPLVSFYLR